MDVIALFAHPFLLLVPAFMLFAILLRVFNRSPRQVSVRGVEKSSDPKRKNRLRFAAAFIGNPLMPLHAILHPQARHAVTERIEDSEDHDTGPTDPTQHLQRQLRKIRNGEKLDRITTRLR